MAAWRPRACSQRVLGRQLVFLPVLAELAQLGSRLLLRRVPVEQALDSVLSQSA